MSNPNPSPETRWKPGQSGNPGGRPKGMLNFAKALSDALTEETLAAICASLAAKAMEGDMSAIKEVADRLDGKSKQQMDVDIKGNVTIAATSLDERI